MKRSIITAFLSFIFIITNGCDINFPISEEWDEVVNLSGDWKFSIGDDSLWLSPKYNDETWDEISVPSSWENEGFHGYNGYAWYRKHFSISQRYKDHTIYLQLGNIDDVDEAYINGKLVGLSGSFPPNYETAYNVLRNYPIPSSFLNFGGDNFIAVRVFDAEQEGGIIRGDVGLFSLPYSLHKEINLEGEWRFSAGDDLSWKEDKLNDKNWLSIIAPGYWESQGFRGYDGYAWYRKKVFISSKLNDEKLVLVLGKIDDVDETFLNGVQIGNTGDFNLLPENFDQNAKYREMRGYYIPKNQIRFDQENIIAIRVYDGFRDGGIYEGPIAIVTQDNYRKYWKRQKQGENIFEKLFGD